ncbi:MAG TPA: LptF/LptG family permease, partial [Saprospiraceae bacterium]|nr:LptF/LptG family permease [Saprospiraceae bacterium]
CFIFIFVGAPLGAIVRKGGYGYPLLLCIFVFVSYILLNTMCKRLSEGLTINTFLGAFIPCMVMCIPAFFLTWTALRDRNMAKDFRILLNRLRTKK